MKFDDVGVLDVDQQTGRANTILHLQDDGGFESRAFTSGRQQKGEKSAQQKKLLVARASAPSVAAVSATTTSALKDSLSTECPIHARLRSGSAADRAIAWRHRFLQLRNAMFEENRGDIESRRKAIAEKMRVVSIYHATTTNSEVVEEAPAESPSDDEVEIITTSLGDIPLPSDPQLMHDVVEPEVDVIDMDTSA